MTSLMVVADDSDISALFDEFKVEGALIIASLDSNIEYVHNDQRAERRYLPASTFKIPNTLITLEERVIKGDKEIIKWDGKERSYEPWNQDHTLATVFSVSCVWCYQEFALKVGNEKYLKYLNELDYGNRKTGKEVTTFWLEGDLAISVREQIDFLRKLYNEELPFSSRNIYLLNKIMLAEETSEYSLWAKTGWATSPKQQYGWYVGYIVTNDNVWLFANNIDINSKDELEFRKLLVLKSLKIKNLIRE
ncbi:MAG: class D beta-lactamase [Proteobacteria bacterium]|nr:class D beta-lactamase [Pseudomonadota bacterium]